MLNQEGRILMKNYRKDGMSQKDIAKKLGVSRRTVYRYDRNGKEEAVYGPRRPKPSKLDRFKPYLRNRLRYFPDLTARRLFLEIRDLGYEGQYTALKDTLRSIRPKSLAAMEVRYETSPGDQAQVDWTCCRRLFTSHPLWPGLCLGGDLVLVPPAVGGLELPKRDADPDGNASSCLSLLRRCSPHFALRPNEDSGGFQRPGRGRRLQC